MEYGNHKKHSAGARNVKARAKRALLLPSTFRSCLSGFEELFGNFWCFSFLIFTGLNFYHDMTA